MRIAEETGGRTAPEFRGLVLVGIGSLAAGIEAAPAEEAFPARDRERHDDAVADLEPGVLPSDFDDLAHGFMADDIAVLHRGNDAVIDMQVGTADGAGRDLDDRIASVLDLGIRNFLAAHVAFAMPG